MLLALAPGCSSDGHQVIVELRSDLLPGIDVARTRTVLTEGRPGGSVVATASLTAMADIDGDAPLLSGARIAELRDVETGSYTLEVFLQDPSGIEIAKRTTLVEIREDIALVVLVTRSCVDVECPGPDDAEQAISCVAGRCAQPDIDACDAPECSADAECGMLAACARPTCVDCQCFYEPMAGACRTGLVCDATRGCVPADGSPPDGGITVTGRRWVTIEPSMRPTPANGLRMVYRDVDGAVYAYGGLVSPDEANAAMWRYVDGDWSSVCDPCAPGPRFAPGMVYDSSRDRIVLVGGTDGGPMTGTIQNDTWVYTETAGWVRLATAMSSPAIFAPRVAYDSNRDVVVMLGGWSTPSTLSSETWELVGDGWQRSPATFPFGIAGFGQSAFFDPLVGEVGFYGGTDGSDELDSLWYFDGARWREECRDCTGRARVGAGVVFDPALGRVLIVGGFDGTEIPGTVHLEGGESVLTDPAPERRDSMGIAYDSSRDVIVVFGGNGATCTGPFGNCFETFEYVPEP
jgi:hypothetical protein